MQLFSKAGTCALSAHIAARWLDLPITIYNLSTDECQADWYRGINPSGKVPAVQLDDGHVMTEAVSILRYFAELAPRMRLDGETSTERQAVAEVLSFLTSEVHANWAPFFRPYDFVSDERMIDEIKASTIDRLSKNYAELDRQLKDSPRIVLNRTTVADAYLYVVTRWLRFLPPDRFRLPNLTRHTRMMEADLIVIRAVTENEQLSNT